VAGARLVVAAGWTQEELAERAGLQREHLSHLETDDYKKPSADTFLRLASALKVDADELFEAAGYIRRIGGSLPKSNGLRPLQAILREAQERYELLETVEVPIRGSIPAGYPERIEENIEGYVSIPREYLQGMKDPYVLRVHGDSLAGDNIHDGDLIVVEPNPVAIVGDKIYVLRLQDEIVARHVYQEKDKLKLISSKREYREIEVTEAEVIGRVTLRGGWKEC